MKKATEARIKGQNGSGAIKKDLMQSSERYQKAIEEQLTVIKHETTYWVKGMAIIGGILFIGYAGYKILIEEEEESAEQEPVIVASVSTKNESAIFKMIKESIALFLISIAKEKIQAFIQSLNIDHEQGDNQSAER